MSVEKKAFHQQKHPSAEHPLADSNIPCCPELIKDDHCDVVHFSRVLTYPTSLIANNRRRVQVEVILRFTLTRCTLGLTLGDPAYSTTLLPGEKVRLATTDRRSRFTYDSETKLSYRSEQISEEQYFMTAFQKYMADSSAAQSGHAAQSSSSQWNFHGDANGSINPFSLSADASTNASGNHNSKSVADYINQQKAHVQSAATQSVSASRKAHSVSIGEVSTRTHIEGSTEEHFESASREFSNPNKCHAVTFIFYRLNKKQVVRFSLDAIERRVVDESAPIGGVIQPGVAKIPIALVPQDVPATAVLKRQQVQLNAVTKAEAFSFTPVEVASFSSVNPSVGYRVSKEEENFAMPLDADIREQALKEVDEQLRQQKLITDNGKVAEEVKQTIEFEMSFSLPTPGVIVKGCLDDCDICEPLVKERMQLKNDLLRKKIELLDKAKEYRCCDNEKEPPPSA